MKTTTVLRRFFSVALLATLFGSAGAQNQNPPAVPANAAGNDVAPQSDPLQNAVPKPATVQADPNAPAVRDGMDSTRNNTRNNMGNNASNNANNNARNTTSGAGNSGTQGNSASSGSLNRADQRILVELAQANLDEVAAAQVALQKSQSGQVKNFAQQMVSDHGQALQDVQQLAQAKGVTLPTAADSKHQKMAARLEQLSGAAFDRAYLQHAGVDDHQKAHAMLTRDQSRATDPDLKALIAKLQPTVDQHLATVQQLARANGGSNASGNSGTRGVSAAGNPNAATSGNTDSPLDPNNPATHPPAKSGNSSSTPVR